MERGRGRGRGNEGGYRGGRGGQGGVSQGGRGGQGGVSQGGHRGGGNQGGYRGSGRGFERGGRGGGGGGDRGGGRGGGGFGGGNRGEDTPSDLPTLNKMEMGAQRGERRKDLPREAFVDLVRTRPFDLKDKRGKSGQAIALKANYISLDKTMDSLFYRYTVDFTMEDDRTGTKKFLIRQHTDVIPPYIYDGNNLYSARPMYPHKLKDNLQLSSSYLKDGSNTIVQVTIKLNGEVHPTEYSYLQIYNSLKNKMLGKLNLTVFNREYFDSGAKVQFKEFGIEVWPGYKTVIRQHENNLLMNVDTISKVIRIDTVLDLIRKLAGGNSRDYQTAIRREIIGAIVMTTYNQKTYKINDIDFESDARLTFDVCNRDNTIRTISYATYYKEKYNVSISDPKQPLLISIPKDKDRRGGLKGPINLIPELCQITGQSDEIKANFRLQEAIHHLTRRDPPSRVQNLLDFARRLNNPEVKKIASDFDLKIAKDLVDVDARVLPQESILLRNSQPSSYSNADWTNDLKKGMATVKDFTFKWAIVFPQNDSDKVRAFYDTMKKAAIGIRFGPPKLIPVDNPRNVGSYLIALKGIVSLNPDFVLVVTPDDRSDRYGAIKKLLLLENSISNQVVTVRKCMNNEKRMTSIATKVYIQMQCKIGAEAWRTNFSTPGIMVVGFDVYHDTTRKNTSVGAMVASVNPQLTRYHTTTLSHKDNTELSTQIATMLVNCLRAYQSQNNGSLPTRIIFYRDGVGEGNIFQVKEDELKNVMEVLKGINGDPSKAPAITYIIVCKRISTKFFVGGKRSDQFTNPPPGTVVDDVVTCPERHDFYLICQTVRQGTVNPTSYNIIHNGCKWGSDSIQKLTYKLTHLYFNWSGTIKVPAPVQYAHKAAQLIGEHLHSDDIAEHLKDELWYL